LVSTTAIMNPLGLEPSKSLTSGPLLCYNVRMIKIPRYRCAPGAFPPWRVAKSHSETEFTQSLSRVCPPRPAADGALIIGYTRTNPVSSITPRPKFTQSLSAAAAGKLHGRARSRVGGPAIRPAGRARRDGRYWVGAGVADNQRALRSDLGPGL
jgi:hypothetical protein